MVQPVFCLVDAGSCAICEQINIHHLEEGHVEISAHWCVHIVNIELLS